MDRRRAVCCWSLAALVGCASEVIDQAPRPRLPPLEPTAADAPGPYAIGVTSIEASYADATSSPDGERRIPIEIWYPAQATGGAPALYALTDTSGTPLIELPSRLGAVRDAPADVRGAPHPAVVFSHGFGGTRVQSIYLTEYLASHGLVVAAPDHVGNTFADLGGATEITALEAARLRPADVSASLDALLDRSGGEPEGLLSGMVDAARVGVAGHSFGGFTALRIAGASVDVAAGERYCAANPEGFFCEGWGEAPFPASQRDGRFLAALPQAPGGTVVFQGMGLADVAVPTMIQAGTSDQTTPFEIEAAPVFEALPAPAYLLAVDKAGHFTFSDVCALGLPVPEFQDGCGAANIPSAEAQPILQRFATAFLLFHVAGAARYEADLDPAALPAGPATLLRKR
jgi:predicted dienelactone hydrolase